ncbi:MAG: D-glycerate dehydrogenase [Myxococcota bacterium]|nr:D-glycerate dehydrogenase [Myxococcota bacterium]
MRRVFISGPVPAAGVQCLDDDTQIEVTRNTTDQRMTSDAIVEASRGCDGLLSMLYDPLGAETIERLSVKVIANFAVGYDNIDVDAATARGIAVVNTPGVLTEATADMAWALLLGSARRLGEGHDLVRSGAFHGWHPDMLLGGAVHGQTLGILGMGRIGAAVARRARGFGMTILYHNRAPRPDLDQELGTRWVTMEELAERSDFLSVHMPLTPGTRGLIGADLLRRMKSTAYLVNTARGEVVDEDALLQALREGWIAGAGLDVFAHEMDGIDPRWFDAPNVLLAPHLGSATVQTRTAMARLAAEGLAAVLRGDRPKNLVNPNALAA